MSKKNAIKRNAMLWLLVICSAVLLSIPFLYPHLGMVSLVGFVPLLAAEKIATENKKRFFGFYYYTGFLLWNLFTTYWIYNATLPGMIAAVVLNALQMAVIFRLFRWFKTLTKGFLPYMFFIITWIAWEHAYFTAEISWPWLVLGNAFSTSIKSIQWYEYTGALGGSLWVLLVNTLLFRLMQLVLEKKRYILSVASLALLVAVPIILSHIIFYTYEEPYFEPTATSNTTATSNATAYADGSRKFTVLQPNIDPYTDKFSGLSQQQQNTILLQLAAEAMDKAMPAQPAARPESAEPAARPASAEPAAQPVRAAHFVIAPETFVSRHPLIDEGNPLGNRSFQKMRNFVMGQPENVNMIFGAVTDKFYLNYENVYDGKGLVPPTESARYVQSQDLWFDRSNTAIFIDSKGDYEFYNKSKLVVLVETIPYKKFFNLMSRFVIDLGGAIGSYATQKEREVFTTPDSVKIGTAICYESVYGDYYREYILKGAHVMSIITNDGWWGDTPGYRQHLSYASLRAIETRRSIARSANTGISALINQRGEVIANTGWWKPAYINGELKLNNKLTVFVKHGDITGRICKFLFFLFLLMAVSRFISKKFSASTGTL